MIDELDSLRIVLPPVGQAGLAVALMTIMFSVALGLSVRDFAFIRAAPGTFVAGALAQLIGLPLMTLCLLTFLSPPPSIALGMIVVACCPGGSVSNLLTYLGRGNLAYSVALTATSSTLAAIVTPASILFWSHRYPPTATLLQSIDVSPALFLIQTMALLGAPLLAGMVVAARAPEVAARLRALTTPVGAMVLAGTILYGSFVFLPVLYPAALFLIGVAALHNGLAFALGLATGAAVRTDGPTRRALTFEVGIQNSGLAIVILLGQLEGLGGAAAIAATWGVWHLIAGGLIVALLRKLDETGAR
ncbi:MAG: bile acid:sodium symporter family protein [Pseudomonadota bacterium]